LKQNIAKKLPPFLKGIEGIFLFFLQSSACFLNIERRT